MKVELLKEVDWDKTWYITRVDGIIDKYFLSEEDATQRYNTIIGNAKQPPVIEILLTTEI